MVKKTLHAAYTTFLWQKERETGIDVAESHCMGKIRFSLHTRPHHLQEIINMLIYQKILTFTLFWFYAVTLVAPSYVLLVDIFFRFVLKFE